MEQIYQDRDKFAKLVREVASPDVGRMGIEILSFTIKVWVFRSFMVCGEFTPIEAMDSHHHHRIYSDPTNHIAYPCVCPWQDVYDKVEYLSSLGKTQTAAVQRDADIGVAEAERDAGIRVRSIIQTSGCPQLDCVVLMLVLCQTVQLRFLLFLSCSSFFIHSLSPLTHTHIPNDVLQQEAECKKEMMDVKFQADTKMADSKRELEMQKASFNQEVNTKVLDRDSPSAYNHH